jgi:hypothetical protein
MFVADKIAPAIDGSHPGQTPATSAACLLCKHIVQTEFGQLHGAPIPSKDHCLIIQNAGLPHRVAPIGTTNRTNSHLAKLQQTQQVIAYAHLAKAASCQAIGHRSDGRVACNVTNAVIPSSRAQRGNPAN